MVDLGVLALALLLTGNSGGGGWGIKHPHIWISIHTSPTGGSKDSHHIHTFFIRCLVVNEMTSSNWAAPDASDPSKTIGQAGLLSFDFYTSQV